MPNIEQFDFSVDLTQALLWQYQNATTLQSLVNQKNSWYLTNFTDFWNNWYTDVFNLATANTFGLAVWAFILNMPLFISTQPTDTGPVFGFSTLPWTNNNYNFNNGNFSPRGSSYILSEEEQRLILRLRFFQVVASNGTLNVTNEFLQTLFYPDNPDFPGTLWALDGLNMTITYVFDFAISEIMQTVLLEYDLLPRPDGVGIRYVLTSELVFGFGTVPPTTHNENFTNGNFFPSPFTP